MVDEVSRSAAKLAAVIAVPVAVLAGFGAFALLNSAAGQAPGPDGSPAPQATGPAPQATGPVAMPERELTERQDTVCRALTSQLPGAVRDLAQRPVTAGPEQNAAYGEPPITVACGVPVAGVAPTGKVWNVDGVCWYERPGQGPGTTLVTVDREVPVEVVVPAGYGGPLQWAGEFTDPLVASILAIEDVPTGCRR